MSVNGTVRRAVTCALVLFCGASGAEMQDSVKASIDYVVALEADCVLDHGYTCRQAVEDDFLTAEAHQRMVPGPFLAAWQVCYEDFKTIADLEPAQKDLKHYKFGFTENPDEFIVLFQALLLPEMVDGQPQGTIRATFGQSTKYWVDRKSLTINKRLFMK